MIKVSGGTPPYKLYATLDATVTPMELNLSCETETTNCTKNQFNLTNSVIEPGKTYYFRVSDNTGGTTAYQSYDSPVVEEPSTGLSVGWIMFIILLLVVFAIGGYLFYRSRTYLAFARVKLEQYKGIPWRERLIDVEKLQQDRPVFEALGLQIGILDLDHYLDQLTTNSKKFEEWMKRDNAHAQVTLIKPYVKQPIIDFIELVYKNQARKEMTKEQAIAFLTTGEKIKDMTQIMKTITDYLDLQKEDIKSFYDRNTKQITNIPVFKEKLKKQDVQNSLEQDSKVKNAINTFLKSLELPKTKKDNFVLFKTGQYDYVRQALDTHFNDKNFCFLEEEKKGDTPPNYENFAEEIYNCNWLPNGYTALDINDSKKGWFEYRTFLVQPIVQYIFKNQKNKNQDCFNTVSNLVHKNVKEMKENIKYKPFSQIIKQGVIKGAQAIKKGAQVIQSKFRKKPENLNPQT